MNIEKLGVAWRWGWEVLHIKPNRPSLINFCNLIGLLLTYEALSLGVIRNALASLTQAELIRQPTSEFEFEGTGKHRLVKVANQDKLVELAAQLGEAVKA